MIKVTTLVENTSKSPDIKAKHGLSFLIETDKHKVLFDLGPDKTFYLNALKKGINLEDIDIVIISHGHIDHCGGLPYFSKINKRAKIYIKKEAFDKHLSKVAFIYHDIGISNLEIDKSRLVYTDDSFTIDDDLMLFSNVTGRKYFSSMNNCLYKQEAKKPLSKDSFDHEQYLIVRENNKDILFTGCSHNGVVNIIEKYEKTSKDMSHELCYVIGGFHLYNPISKKYENEEKILDIAKWINERKEKYITCHCTGKKAFNILKENTNGKVSYFSCGESITLNKDVL